MTGLLHQAVRRRALLDDAPGLLHHVIGDNGVRFRGRMERAAVKGCKPLLQNVQNRRAVAVRVGGQEGIIRSPKEAGMVGLRREEIGLVGAPVSPAR
jgi:hypothetical protein